MKKTILNFANSILKVFKIKLIKIVDQFNNSYKLTLGLKKIILIIFLIIF